MFLVVDLADPPGAGRAPRLSCSRLPLAPRVKLTILLRGVIHDEPLKGDRFGQRSIRLSIRYRAIYEVKRTGRVEFVSIEEVSKHGY